MTDNAESTPNSTTERITRHGNMIVRRAEELEYWVRVDAPGMTREQLDGLLPGYSPEIVDEAAAGVLAARYYATTLEQLHAILTDTLRLPPDVAVTLQSLVTADGWVGAHSNLPAVNRAVDPTLPCAEIACDPARGLPAFNIALATMEWASRFLGGALLKWQKSTQQQPGETPPQQPPSETPPAE